MPRTAPSVLTVAVAAAVLLGVLSVALVVVGPPDSSGAGPLSLPHPVAMSAVRYDQPPLKVLLVGDSMAGSLGVGLQEVAAAYHVELGERGPPGLLVVDGRGDRAHLLDGVARPSVRPRPPRRAALGLAVLGRRLPPRRRRLPRTLGPHQPEAPPALDPRRPASLQPVVPLAARCGDPGARLAGGEGRPHDGAGLRASRRSTRVPRTTRGAWRKRRPPAHRGRLVPGGRLGLRPLRAAHARAALPRQRRPRPAALRRRGAPHARRRRRGRDRPVPAALGARRTATASRGADTWVHGSVPTTVPPWYDKLPCT